MSRKLDDNKYMSFLPPFGIRQLAPLAPILFGTVVAIAAYLQALDYPFIFDDETYITENIRLAGLHLTELWRLFTGPYNSFSEFLPLRDLSYWFDIALFGLTPSAFRMHNILLYLLCLPLVYAATLNVWHYFRPADAASAQWAAAAVTTLFALHPSHAEAVVWISGRKDVLSGMFSLLALWFAMRAGRKQGLSAPHATAALIALLAAMLSKATAVAVAPAIAVLWVIFWHDTPAPAKRPIMLLWPLASLLLAACGALIYASFVTTKVPFYFGVEAVTRSLAVLGWLARLAVSPESRHFFYPVFEDPYLPAMVALGIAVLAAAIVGGAMLLRKRSLIGFSFAVFLLLCMPSLQLIPYKPPSLVSDRFIFLAVWPAMLLIVALLWRLKPVPRTVLLLVIGLSWSFQTTQRPHDWRNFEAFVDTDLRAFPGYYMPALFKIKIFQVPGGFYREALDTASNVTAPEARNIMIQLIRGYAVTAGSIWTGNPQEAMARLLDLGADLKQPPAQAKWNTPMLNFWDESEIMHVNLFESLAKFFPGDVLVRYNAGLSLLNIHKHDDAVTHLRIATESQRLPESARGAAFYNLGLALIKSGHVAEAETALHAALGQPQPYMQAYCLLSNLYKETGRIEEAAHAKAECRKQAPSEWMAQ